MAKSYINNAVIGNSSMLGCIDDKGELIRLYWPNIDYPQHLDMVKLGVFSPGTDRGAVWLDSGQWRREQRYMPDTNILETVYVDECCGLNICQTDFVLPDRAILVRRFELEECGRGCPEDMAGLGEGIGMLVYSSCISTIPQPAGILFDYGTDALIHYRHDYYLSVSADVEALQFQLGNNAYKSAGSGWLRGGDNIGMMPDGAVSWDIGVLGRGGRKSLTLYICISHTLKGVRKLIKEAVGSDYWSEYQRTVSYWTGFLGGIRRVNTGNEAIDGLYRRSALVFKLMADENTGGLLASPEIDEEFTKCGRYAYCWGRDAAFITEALDWCGLSGTVGKFYRWAAGTQEIEGYWRQRYHMDGNLAPSWGLQADETGSVIRGILRHYEATGDMLISFGNVGMHREGRRFSFRIYRPGDRPSMALLRYMGRKAGRARIHRCGSICRRPVGLEDRGNIGEISGNA